MTNIQTKFSIIYGKIVMRADDDERTINYEWSYWVIAQFITKYNKCLVLMLQLIKYMQSWQMYIQIDWKIESAYSRKIKRRVHFLL